MTFEAADLHVPPGRRTEFGLELFEAGRSIAAMPGFPVWNCDAVEHHESFDGVSGPAAWSCGCAPGFAGGGAEAVVDPDVVVGGPGFHRFGKPAALGRRLLVRGAGELHVALGPEVEDQAPSEAPSWPFGPRPPPSGEWSLKAC